MVDELTTLRPRGEVEQRLMSAAAAIPASRHCGARRSSPPPRPPHQHLNPNSNHGLLNNSSISSSRTVGPPTSLPAPAPTHLLPNNRLLASRGLPFPRLRRLRRWRRTKGGLTLVQITRSPSWRALLRRGIPSAGMHRAVVLPGRGFHRRCC